MKNYVLKLNLYIFVLSFFIHLIWETLHSPLYAPFDLPLNQFIPLILGASFIDGIIMISFYWIGYFKNKDFKWIFRIKKGDYALIIIIGFLLASAIEIISTNVSFGWTYKTAMPIIPIINVGLTPVIQLMLLPFIIFWLTKKIFNK